MDALFVTNLFLLLMILLIAGLNYLLPLLSRREIFFAITVSGGYRDSPAARETLRRYRTAVCVHALIAVGLVAAAGFQQIPWLPIAAIFWLAGGCFVAFLMARHETLPHAQAPAPQREAAVAPRPAGIFSSFWLQACPFVILAAAAAYLYFHWNDIPERFPVHWSLRGQPDRWSTRSFSGVFLPLFMGASLCLGLAVMSYAMQHWTRQVRARGSGPAQESFFRSSQRGIVWATELFLAATFSWTACIPLQYSATARMPGLVPILVGATLFIFFVVGWLIYTGQGGEHLPRPASEPSPAPEELPAGDRTPDQCWKAGVIYVNRNDPAILVERRFGVGYTLNFGHPLSWILLGSLILIPLLLSFFLARAL